MGRAFGDTNARWAGLSRLRRGAPYIRLNRLGRSVGVGLVEVLEDCHSVGVRATR